MADQTPQPSTGPTPVTLADITATPVDLIKRSLVKACLLATSKARLLYDTKDKSPELTAAQKIHEAASLVRWFYTNISNNVHQSSHKCYELGLTLNLDPKKIYEAFNNLSNIAEDHYTTRIRGNTIVLPLLTVVRVVNTKGSHGEAISSLNIIINGKTNGFMSSDGRIDKTFQPTNYVTASDLEVQTCVSVLSAPQIRTIMSNPIFDAIVTEAFGLEEDMMGKVTIAGNTQTS